MLVTTVARLHTLFVTLSFVSAFFFGCLLHYQKIVTNADFSYPDEWLPSVSATIGDWFPERNIFQTLMALASGPRLALIVINYTTNHSMVYLAVALVRTVAAGGWIFVTSTDSHAIHDNAMIVYVVASIGYYCICCRSRVLRRILALFFINLVPLIWNYYRHKVLRLAGAYSWYALFEWVLVALDIGFDYFANLSNRRVEVAERFGKV